MLTAGLVLATVLTLGAALPASPAFGAAASCAPRVSVSGYCSAITGGTSVSVGGERTSPSTPSGRTPSGAGGPITTGEDGPRYSRPDQNYTVDDCRGVSDLRCSRVAPPDPPTTPPPAPGTPAITISDVASFAPAPPSTLAEPSNLGVAGRPANFIATAAAHTREGTVLGTRVTVRFTPASFTFDYGDGTTATRPTGGASWTELGQAPFTPTDTSHVYEHRGTYDTTVTVHYTAGIDLGTGWIPLDGSLPVTSPTRTIRIYEAHTALVHHTCIEDPDAPGC